MKTKVIKITDIVIDAGTQQREKINNEIVAEYAEAIKCGNKFPAVTVFFNGAEYYLVDGFHRYNAIKDAGCIDEMLADIIDGTKREAVLYSLGVNDTHGIRLTNADKRKAVNTMLKDDEWRYWTDSLIAKHCKVTSQFVGKLRKGSNNIQKDIISKDIETVSISPLEPAQNLETDNSEQDDIRKELYELDPVVELEQNNQEIDTLNNEIKRINKIVESDEPLAAAMAEVKRLNALVLVLEERMRGFQSSENQAKKQAQFWKKKHDKLEKQMKSLGLVEF